MRRSHAVLVFLALLAAAPGRAEAVDWGVRLDGAIAFPVTAPQSDRFLLGGSPMLKGSVGVRWVDFHIGAGWLGLTAKSPFTEDGGSWIVGGGLRVKLPRDRKRAISPWIDGDALYARTGDLDRAGFAFALGCAFGLDQARHVWLGPFARYLQVTGGVRNGIDDRDAKILMIGAELEIGPRRGPPGAPGDRDKDGILDKDDRCIDDPGVIEFQGCPDRDKDGIPDKDDQCVDVPGLAAIHGCPDKDGDGITDAMDKCVDEPGPKATNGCPDKDGDGVLDRDDKCVSDPGPASEMGCPDTDGDGLHDHVDVCPKVKGTKENRGCPDRDDDTVVDPEDACPDKKGDPSNRGCPIYKTVKVAEGKLEILQKIFFALNSTKLLPKSFPVLDDVARVLNDAPQIHVSIEGHTSSEGDLDHNVTLSKGRAASVLTYLVTKRSIKADRLASKGYGPTKPLATNDTMEGREQNRRVEFVIVDQPQDQEGSTK